MKVLFLTQTSSLGSSARYRVYQYIDYLESKGIKCTVIPLLSDQLLKRYSPGGPLFLKIKYYGSQFFKGVSCIFKVKNFDIVFFQRDMVIYLFPIIEWIISRLNRNIIFDVDDAIHLYPSYRKPSLVFKLLGDRQKLKRLAKLSQYVIAGNNYLKNYLQAFNHNVSVIPNSIDTTRYILKKEQRVRSKSEPTIIGWIGTPGTTPYLKIVEDALPAISKRYNIVLRIIGAKHAPISGVLVQTIEWNLETEVEEIQKFDIGIMPLTYDRWSQSKSGTKLLQYLAAGIATVASPVGINKEIISNGYNGFLARDNKEWIEKISILIKDEELRWRFGVKGRETVERYYSIKVNAPKIKEILEKVGFSSNL